MRGCVSNFRGKKNEIQKLLKRWEKITLALSWNSQPDFQQVCQLLQSFTAKFGMDWRGSTEAKSTRVSAEQSSGEFIEVKIKSPLVYLSWNHYWPFTWYLSTACLAAALENTHLGLDFVLRCIQYLFTPCVATLRFPLEEEQVHHRHVHYRSSRTMSDWPQYSSANTGYGPNCLTHALPFFGNFLLHFHGGMDYVFIFDRGDYVFLLSKSWRIIKSFTEDLIPAISSFLPTFKATNVDWKRKIWEQIAEVSTGTTIFLDSLQLLKFLFYYFSSNFSFFWII